MLHVHCTQHEFCPSARYMLGFDPEWRALASHLKGRPHAGLHLHRPSAVACADLISCSTTLFARWALQPAARDLHNRLCSSLGCLVKVLDEVGHICRGQCLCKLCSTSHTCTICSLLSTCS